MIRTPTVFLLGAGASVPYGFDTGEELLERARALDIGALKRAIEPAPAMHSAALYDALANTLEFSIDAMLERRANLEHPGKALIARQLLQQERTALKRNHTSPRPWYRVLFAALDAPRLEDVKQNAVTFVTYNYDRSLEHSLVRALQVKFDEPQAACVAVVESLQVIHLHGQLGPLPGFRGADRALVEYGGGGDGMTDGDVLEASKGIRIVHEPRPTDEPFVRARAAIAASNQLIILGFGYAPRNVERLLLRDCLRKETNIFACAKGFTEPQQATIIRSPFQGWANLTIGNEHHDIIDFFRNAAAHALK